MTEKHYESLTQLGQRVAPPASPQEAQLETFVNPHADVDYVVRLTAPEFTTVCPMTGQPDFAMLELEFVPDRLCVELKSLKLYVWSFRDRGAFHEAVTNETIRAEVMKQVIQAALPAQLLATTIHALLPPACAATPRPDKSNRVTGDSGMRRATCGMAPDAQSCRPDRAVRRAPAAPTRVGASTERARVGAPPG